MGLGFIVVVPLLPSHCGSPLSLDVEYFFGEFQCLPVDFSAVSCDSGALTEGVSARPSTPPS